MKLKRLLTALILLVNFSCQAQNNKKMENKNSLLICDPVEGVCGIPDSASDKSATILSTQKPLKIIYFTDPICSSCWGIEPQLRKLKLEYGDNFEIEYRMGGLLPDWSYNSGGISKPSDVAHHWDEVSLYYDMPIDGDVWLEDPLHSSYPPSIAFKAAQIQDKTKSLLFLRELREMVFLQKKNITKWEHLEYAAQKVGLNIEQLKNDYNNSAKWLFEEDLNFAKQNGVRGFPTLIFVDTLGNKEKVYGTKPYDTFENAVLKLLPNTQKSKYDTSWEFLFTKYKSFTVREFSELSGKSRNESESILNELTTQGKLTKLITKNGYLWSIK